MHKQSNTEELVAVVKPSLLITPVSIVSADAQWSVDLLTSKASYAVTLSYKSPLTFHN